MKKLTEKIVYTSADEDLRDNGTISDGIHNTSVVLDHTLKGASNISEVLRGIEVIKNTQPELVN
ncbi:hypothetical protein [Siminovitchia terrae]|uniref:hypothetical protein n=1 Tax=Siminovitchia terrae TaxID=1914933 RepID=UPI0028B1646C|nr:hypothetical protein [Siminovitchia terrae]